MYAEDVPGAPLPLDTDASVRVLVVGDRGVGKTALVQLLCTGAPSDGHAPTVGADVSCSVHATTAGSACFVEWCDVGGSPAYEAARAVWYAPYDAIVAVYDVTNINSRNNLDVWLREVVALQYLDAVPWAADGARALDLRLHPNKELAGRVVPVLLVGNKLDLVGSALALRAEFRDDVVVSAHDATLLQEAAFVQQLNAFLDATVASRRTAAPGGRRSAPLLTPSASPAAATLRVGLSGFGSPFDARAPSSRRVAATEVRLRIDFDAEDQGTAKKTK